MKMTIPGELWNQVAVPSSGTTSTLISTYLSEMAYKLPSITDVMMTKEFWHTVCEFAERCGALRERISGTSPFTSIVVGSPTFGDFQRFVGAGVNGAPVGFDEFSVSETAQGAQIEFNASSATSSYADISVVPDITAAPNNQKAPLWFLKRYDRALMSGTLMRIYSMSGAPWSDSATARQHAMTYLREVNRVTHGLITSGMRRQVLTDAEALVTRQNATLDRGAAQGQQQAG